MFFSYPTSSHAFIASSYAALKWLLNTIHLHSLTFRHVKCMQFFFQNFRKVPFSLPVCGAIESYVEVLPVNILLLSAGVPNIGSVQAVPSVLLSTRTWAVWPMNISLCFSRPLSACLLSMCAFFCEQSFAKICTEVRRVARTAAELSFHLGKSPTS